jgi:hypothetical protein
MTIGGSVRVPGKGIVVVSPFDGSRTIVRAVPAQLELPRAP